jgi:hypothetical protein
VVIAGDTMDLLARGPGPREEGVRWAGRGQEELEWEDASV